MSQGRRSRGMIKGSMCDISVLRRLTSSQEKEQKERHRNEASKYFRLVRESIFRKDQDRFKLFFIQYPYGFRDKKRLQLMKLWIRKWGKLVT